jgi:inhibitor of cysteine peptidase
VTIQKNEKDAGSLLEMNKEDRLEIVLKSNPTTGFQWTVVSLDSSILTHIGTEYKAANTARNIVGSGGRSTFHFKATKAGKTDLKLIYHQPFEKDTPPVKTFELSVIVKD